jgi:hypothetical protein
VKIAEKAVLQAGSGRQALAGWPGGSLFLVCEEEISVEINQYIHPVGGEGLNYLGGSPD